VEYEREFSVAADAVHINWMILSMLLML